MEDFNDYIVLLCELIQKPSPSGEEEGTADLLQHFFESREIRVQRIHQNIVCRSSNWKENQPTILLCSHHDTVKPNNGYTRDPYSPDIENGKLYGLGSNDAGGCLVALIGAFLALESISLPFNLILAAVAEEETSGPKGVSSILPMLPDIHLAIVGEPTGMRMAIAEKGLLVIDGIAVGKPGHAAHSDTVNPIYQACRDALLIEAFNFDRISDQLGKTRASVTQINAGTQHNQVPATCQFVIDVRVNEHYSNQEVFELLQQQVDSQLTARSFRLNSSGIDPQHPIMRTAQEMQIPTFGSGTLSDQALLPFSSIKMGPGDTLRSHTADEFVYIEEVKEGIELYISLLSQYQPI